MNPSNYYGLVRNTLLDVWGKGFGVDSGRVEIALLTRLTLEVVHEKKEGLEVFPLVLENRKEGEPLDVERKIQDYVKEHAFLFNYACGTVFSPGPYGETRLKSILEPDARSVVRWFDQEDWLSEGKLEALLGRALLEVKPQVLMEACQEFKDLHQGKDLEQRNRAGHYLLYLFKKIAKCGYSIPEKESFTSCTVSEVLAGLTEGSLIGDEKRFIEAMVFRRSDDDRPFYIEFLQGQCAANFLDFVTAKLRTLPLCEWPSKTKVIRELLQQSSYYARLQLASDLAESEDRETANIGADIQAAFEITSFTEAIPYFEALVEQLSLDDETILNVFGRPFVQESLRLCSFVGKEGSLRIGVYDTPVDRKANGVPSHLLTLEERIPPYLLAYEEDTKKMVWGLPLSSPILESPPYWRSQVGPYMSSVAYCMKQVGGHIALQYSNEGMVRFINAGTGECEFVVRPPLGIYDGFHMSHSTGSAYLVSGKEGHKRRLLGGLVTRDQEHSHQGREGRWDTVFGVQAPSSGSFLSLSTHCGFLEKSGYIGTLEVFGPTGHSIAISDCRGAIAHNDKLYSLETRSLEEGFLVVRTLRVDEEVLSNVEKSIPLPSYVWRASFKAVPEGNKVALFIPFEDRTIFIDLETGQEVSTEENSFL